MLIDQPDEPTPMAVDQQAGDVEEEHQDQAAEPVQEAVD